MSNAEDRKQKLSPLQQAAFALKKKQAELDAVKSARKEPIAIIGMSCRFPGADSPEAYWQLLQDGVDATTETPSDRWDLDIWFDPDPDVLGKISTRRGGFVSEVDKFDPHFFGISAREAVDLDPQQRMVLEVAWEALEYAGKAPEELVDRSVGSFIGVTNLDYATFQYCHPENITAYTTTGVGSAYAAGRLSYVLGLQGPAFVVDTACSSSLVAIHQACMSLRNRECELALAGGVNLNLSPTIPIFLSRVRALAPDGRCKAFDASGDGYGRGEGCGIIVLKRLSDAIFAKDNILALIRGSAINHDGPATGFTAPNRSAQEKLIHLALQSGDIQPAEVGYIEAHGTGTPLGDPIEVAALETVFGPNHSQEAPLILGSSKTNLGHLESAAGVAGLVKIVLAMQNEEIPPHLHFKTPNSFIDWENLPFRIPLACQPWPRGQRARIAGVSSFGMSGTNAHVLLAEAPVPKEGGADEADTVSLRSAHLLTLSAKTPAALTDLAGLYGNWLASHPDVSLPDVCFTANTGRSHFEYRLALVAASPLEAKKLLLTGEYSTGHAPYDRPKLVFLFTGQGAEYLNMGRQLFTTQPIFRQIMERCDAILRPLNVPLLDLLYPDSDKSVIEIATDMTYLQPVLFALEYSLARLWQHWGVHPDVVMGHSIGEYVAACVAGIFSLEDGLKLVAARGRLMQTCEEGRMLAVSVGEEEALALIAPYGEEVSIATINSPSGVVLSGRIDAVEGIVAALNAMAGAERPDFKLLPIPRASHSPLMEPILGEFGQVTTCVTYAAPKVPLCSNVTGQMATDEITTPGYWVRHLRQPVRFAASVKTLYEQGFETFLEIGPKPALLGMASQCLPDGAGVWLPSLRQDQEDWRQMLQSLGQWHIRGGSVDWLALENNMARRKIPLPTYPFQRQRYWIDKARLNRRTIRDSSAHPLLGQKLDWADSDNKIRFESRIDLAVTPWLADHRVFDVAVFPGTGYLEMALAASADVILAGKWQDSTGDGQNRPLQVQDIVLERALILPEENDTRVQLVLSPDDDGYQFQIFSQDAQSQWTPHVLGRLVGEDQSQPLNPPKLDIPGLQSQCPTAISAADHYRFCREQGLNYGPNFQGVKKIFCGEGLVLGEIELPEEAVKDIDKYFLHPMLFDAALQVGLALVPTDSRQDTYLPVSIKRLQRYRPAASHLWAQARYVGSDEKYMTAHISLLDDAGAIVAMLEEITLERVAPEVLARHFKNKSDELYEINWIPRALPMPDAGGEIPATDSAGSWLILADGGRLGEELAARLEAAGDSCILVYAEESAGKPVVDAGDGKKYLNPAEPDGFLRLFREELTEEMPALRGIVHLWSIDAPDSATLTTEQLLTAQTLVCGSVVYLLQAQIQQALSARLWLVTRHGVGVGDVQDDLAVAQAPLWGLGKTIAQEYPELWGALIDAPEAAELLTEILSEGPEDQVAYRDGQRYVPRLVNKDFPGSDSDVILHSDACYLITGGLGGIGLKIAAWMAEEGACHLVLTGRRAPSVEAQAVLQELEERGVQILVVSTDVSDQEQMAHLFAQLDARMPPLKGVIHAAGLLDDAVLLQQDMSRFHNAMAPKVAGGWHLHTMTLDRPLDFFACFSSTVSLFGASGQANYAAANAFLDALACYRHTLGLPGLAINWGSWANVGLAANLAEKDIKRLTDMGFERIPPEHGILILGRLMGQPANTQVGASPMHWGNFLRQFAAVPPFFSEIAQSVDDLCAPDFLGKLADTPPAKQREYLNTSIQSEINRVLGFDISAPINPQTNFSDLGMDSLMIVESRNRLQAMLKHPLPSTLLFNYPTLDALVGYLADEVLAINGSAMQTEPSSPERDESGDTERAVVSEVKELSDDDLKAFLNQEFDAIQNRMHALSATLPIKFLYRIGDFDSLITGGYHYIDRTDLYLAAGKGRPSTLVSASASVR